MTNKYFLLFFLLIFSNQLESDIYLDTETCLITIYLEETKTINAIVDLESEFSFIDDYSLPTSSLTTSKIINNKLTFQIDNKEANGIELNDYINLNKNSIRVNDFSFIIYNNEFSKTKSISFSYKYRKNHNLIHLMTKQNIISNPQFTFHINNDKGKLYYGDIPNDILSQFQYNLNIPVKSSNKNWDFELGFIFIGDISYKYENIYYYNQNKASFSTNTKGILAPEMAFDFIVENIFNESFSKNICRKTISVDNEIECMCDKLKDENLKKITFVIQEKSIDFNTKQYFDILGNRCIFQIRFNNIKRDEWKFGISFLSKFLATFNYGKSQIILRTKDKNFESVDVNTLFPLKRIIIWTLVVVIILVIPFMYKIAKDTLKKHRERRLTSFIKDFYTQLQPIS